MKIDRSRVRKSTSEVPLECQQLIERLQQCSRTELLDELSKIHSWTFGKCELLHWAQVLDIFDKILGEAAERNPENKWILKCDTYNESELSLLICILRFTSLLIEHSFSRHLYNSMEHLLGLQESNEMSVVLEVLNLLYMFSKRSNFITRLKAEEKDCLLVRLSCLGESWGGKENGFGLADCCNPDKDIPSSATTLHVEFHQEEDAKSSKSTKKDIRSAGKPNLHIIHIEHIDKLHKTPAEIMKSLVSLYYVPTDKEVWLFTHVRLATHFADYQSRLKMVQARLQALSVIVYSNAIQEVSSNLLYNGLLEELVEVVELQDPHLSDIRCAALRTLTAIIHLDRGPHLNRRPAASRLNNIIDVTGASLYHGFLPALVRNCISSLTNQVDCGQSAFKKMKLQDSTSESDDFNDKTISNLLDENDTNMEVTSQHMVVTSVVDSKYPVSLTTALFSFLYHLASYQSGGEALVSCGMMESLLQVINWQGFELDHINFVTRAVRVIDLITNIDMTAFQTYGGLYSFISRLDIEVNFCKKDQLYRVNVRTVDQMLEEVSNSDASTSVAIASSSGGAAASSSVSGDKDMDEDNPTVNNADVEYVAENAGKSCLPQRAALLKSMLNFLKKAFNDAAFSESIRHLMEGTLPNSLKNLIANAEYYGASLFLLATDVVTVYVYQEPSLLSALQDNGLTEIILYALLVKEVPATREVLGSLPNVFSALCLNNRGLEAFAKYNPFQKLFNILLSPNYLPAMRRRRSSEPTNDTASVLGNAMDELMRHQPSLRQDATMAIINLLEELVYMGTDPKFVCWRPHSKSDVLPPNNSRSTNNTEGSSDEEEEDEEEASTSSQNAQTERMDNQPQANSERQPIALIDYILNAMKFIDSILSNNSTDDHCREFCDKGGITPLLKILGLPNLPVDCPVTNPAQAVATVCKSILNLAHEPFLFSQGLSQLGAVLENLKPLYSKTQAPGASKLLLELVGCSDLDTAFSTASATPLLHAMNAAHGYVIMFVHICRTGQTDIRNLSLQHWGSQEGLAVLQGLSELYTSLVWESTLLLAYCSDDLSPSECDFRREDIEKLNTFFDKYEGGTTSNSSSTASDSNSSSQNIPGTSAPTTTATTTTTIHSAGLDPLTANYAMELDSEITINKDSRNLKIIRPLLGASSRLGRALAELFGLLVKLCVGPPIRQRRGQNIVSAPPIPSLNASNVATALNKLLVEGLDCEKLALCPNPKCRLTFLICSIGFTSPMLFDERRYPYHLMLKKFISQGGQNTLFKTFQWALNVKPSSTADSIDYSALTEGTMGFLDAWLTLVEKLVNPKTLIESPHVVSNRTGSSVGFEPYTYLKKIHKQAFDNIRLLWRKKRAPYGERTTETLLTIMRHIFRGEKLIKEKMKSEENKTETPATSSAGPSTEPVGLRQLVDMGFSRESALEALQHTSSLEHATEYLLSNPSHMSRSTNSMEVGLEEDQVQQAIAISLENSGASTSDVPAPSLEEQEKQFEAAINEFATNALEDFLNILDELPDTVHKVCDLLVTLMKRNPIEYSEKVFDTLIEEMMKIIHYLSYYVFNNSISIVNYYSVVLSETPQRLHSILHLFILLFESPFCNYMKGKCGLKLYKKRATTITITLITRVVDMMIKLRAVQEPKWLAPAILFVDLLAKADVCHTRKIYMHLTTSRVWRWYDLITGRWTVYSNNNSRLINEAYWSGEPTVRITCGRKRYTVTFNNMLQTNDETGNNRPIGMTLATFSHPNCSDINGLYIPEPLYTELTVREENRALPILGGSTFEQKMMLIKATCDLLALPTIDKNILHSALQLTARLTRDYEMAKVFVNNGGIKSILALRQINDFPGFGILATILIRHTLEEPNTLQYSMEKIIRSKTLSTIPPPYKDLIYVLRQISGAVARHPYIFWHIAAEIIRVDTTHYKGEPAEVTLPIKVEPPSRTKAPPLEDACSFEVISELLKALLEPLEDKNVGDHEKQAEPSQINSKLDKTDQTNDAAASSSTCTKNATGIVTMSNASSQTGESSSQTSEDSGENCNKTTDDNAKNDDDNKTPEEKERSGFKNTSKKPMLPKSVILKILADAVVSYGPIAKMITDYKYKSTDSEFLTEDTTSLAFIFDKILPTNPNISDSDCATMCRMLIAALASSNHSPEAQITLVSEVKLALTRALNQPESTEKHNQIQNICGIISTMIDNCPLLQSNRWSNCSINNMVKLMIKRGVFNDLAKITHYLDLSSPNTSFTANEALKPLESLSRTINQPSQSGNQSKSRKSHHTNEDNTEPPTSSTEQTNAQGEELEDTENTERDISAVASSLENNSVSTGRLDNTLEEMMQHILQHRSDNSQGYNDVPSSRNTTMDIDEECTIDYDHERDATEELMSTDSGESDSNPSDQVDDDGNDDNDGDDDNIDDNEDNDDNNYYDDDNDRRRSDDFELIEGGALFRLAANERDEDILMIQYETETNNAVPRMIRWNENGYAIFDQSNNTEHSGTITHPLLVSRSSDSTQTPSTRAQRANRARRYQYLFSPRNPNPPVILQRLLGPDDPHSHLANVFSNNLFGGPDLRENTRVVVMDNFGILPSNEEQIDFVDQSGYLLGPSLAATLAHIPPVMHWWNIESKLLDVESSTDAVTFVCNKLIPTLINIRNEELRNKKAKEKEDGAKKAKQRTNPDANSENTPETVVINDDESTNASAPNEQSKQGDEDLDGEPVEISDTSNESSQDSDVLLTRLPSFLRGNENSQTTEVTQNASVQTIDPSESVTRVFGTRSETFETDTQSQSNPFEMSLTAYVRSRNNAFGRPIGSPSFQQIEQFIEADTDVSSLDVQTHNNPLRAIFEETISQQSDSPSSEQASSQPAEASLDNTSEPTTAEQRDPETETAASPQEHSTAETNSAAAADAVVAGPSSSNDDEEIPEGVDPSFLEALPPEIRREVLEQHRILCIQQRYRAAQESGEEYILSTPQVSPDFLAALPPSLQEEVLSQHRIELQRQAAARANPDEPVDAASFFETLQPSLRTMILSDMEDSQMSALPPDLAQEAQNLRRDWYARNRQIAQERFLQTNLSTLYRHSRGRQSIRHNSFARGNWGPWSRDFTPNSVVSNNQVKIRGRQLLDHEGISCLLILLFTDDSHLNKLRLHRVIRNLCYHAPTREWVINSLLAIIEKSVNVQLDETDSKPTRKGPKPGPLTSKLLTDTKHLQNGGHWLTIRMEAALGCAANVFILNKATGKKCDKSSGANTISIHPQAAPIVCKNTLDLLTSLAKAFPSCLIPIKTGREEVDKNSVTPVKIKLDSSDFWDVLIRLDSSTKKGKSIQKQSNTSSTISDSETAITFEQTAFGKLLNMLASPVVKRNTQLTDNLLKLLSVTTSGMPDLNKPQKSGKGKSVATEIINKPPTHALNLVVNVITYQNCSEEGLEFITNLLLNLANSSLDMSLMILNLLLNGAVEIGSMVEQQIQDMLKDLRDLIGTTQKRKLEDNGGPSSSKGVIYNRFTNEQVIVTASTKVKSACELQLPSMIPLTSKSSGQIFFLRVLRVIVQIRNSIKQSMKKETDPTFYELPALSDQLTSLNSLWDSLSMCLLELEHAPDHHAVLVLQPTVEAFFLVHSPQQGAAKHEKKEDDEATQGGSESESSAASRKISKTSTEGSETREVVIDLDRLTEAGSVKSSVPPEQHFLAFAEKHRTVLNQILRQSTAHLADGPFAVLVDHTRVLDFDIKRRYFRTELERMDHGVRREETAVHVRRNNIFEDSFRELFRRPPEEWKNRFYIVFEDEEGQDAGGLLREWYVIISRDIFNPMYALFTVSPGDRVTYMINSASHYNTNHLCYYKFVGRVIAKAIYDNKLLECYFTRSFYKHILGIPVKYTDMESEDYSFYRGLVYLMENNISNMDIDLTFSTEISEFGVTETRDLIPNGRHIPVTEENKMEYIRLVCQMKMTGAIKQQLNSFLEGFYDIIPMRLISIFNEQELELLISGLPNVDIEDLRVNTEYHKYQTNSLQIQWFWRALRSFDQADRAKFLQFVTGTSKVPLQGFGALEGMNGVQKFQIHRDDRSTDRLPSAHTCFNQLDLPVYETYDKLRAYLLKAIHECSEGFGFA